MSLKDLLYSLIGIGPLNSIEKAVLEGVQGKLPEDLALKLEAQIKSINKVQRFTKDKEVNLYYMVKGKSIVDEHYRFPTQETELLLAKVAIADSHNNRMHVKVWMVNGQIFTLAFSKPQCNLKGIIQVTNVILLPDPGLSLSMDYNDFIAPPNFSSFHEWSVLRPDHIREIVLDYESYYVVAEHQVLGMLAVRELDVKPQLYLIQYENNHILPCGTTLRDALRYASIRSDPN